MHLVPVSPMRSRKKRAPRDRSGPVYMGSGLGALQPLFDRAAAEGDALQARRDEALAAAKKARDTPAEKQAGEKIRAYFTSERDLWATRTNQAIDVVTRKILPRMQDREAVGIAREFRHQPIELQAFIDGSHPFFEDVDGGAAQGREKPRPADAGAAPGAAHPVEAHARGGVWVRAV